MNCQELKQDIKELEKLYSQLRNSFESSSESGQGKIKLTGALDEANKGIDEMLERYLPDFIEHNPELSQWQLGEKIVGQFANTKRISTLPDGSALVGGADGALYHVTRDGEKWDGSWDIELIGKLIEGEITSVSTLPDGSALIGGNDGALYHATRDGEKWDLKFIDGFKEPGSEESAWVLSISVLPDGSALVGGASGALYHATRDGEKWDLKFIDGFKEPGSEESAWVLSISTLPDGSALVGGTGGTVYSAIPPIKDVKALKQNLGKIIAKGTAN